MDECLNFQVIRTQRYGHQTVLTVSNIASPKFISLTILYLEYKLACKWHFNCTATSVELV